MAGFIRIMRVYANEDPNAEGFRLRAMIPVAHIVGIVEMLERDAEFEGEYNAGARTLIEMRTGSDVFALERIEYFDELLTMKGDNNV